MGGVVKTVRMVAAGTADNFYGASQPGVTLSENICVFFNRNHIIFRPGNE